MEEVHECSPTFTLAPVVLGVIVEHAENLVGP
jgi:hypothetical protein